MVRWHAGVEHELLSANRRANPALANLGTECPKAGVARKSSGFTQLWHLYDCRIATRSHALLVNMGKEVGKVTILDQQGRLGSA